MKKSLPVLLTGAAGKAKGYFTKKNTDLVNVLKLIMLIILAPALALPGKLFAQAPTISYSSPQTFREGTAITLAPTSSGVAAQGYSNSLVSIGQGLVNQGGVAVDAAGNVYVNYRTNDTDIGLVKKFPAGGGAAVTIGSGFGGNPGGIAVDAAGNVYITDYGDKLVEKIPAGGGAAVSIGSGFGFPLGVAVDNAGNVYVADYADGVKKIPAGGGSTVSYGSGLQYASGIAVDAAGNVYVACTNNDAVFKIPAGGGTPVNLGYFNFYSGYALYTRGIAVDAKGDVYVAEEESGYIKKIPVGGGTTVALGPHFYFLDGVAVDGAGNVYVSDDSLTNIQEIKPVGGYYINAALPAGLTFDENTGIISGTPTAAVPATNYTITAYNSKGSSSATVKIEVVSSVHNASLANLAISAGMLTPAFAAGTDSYTATVSSLITSITITPTTSDPNATVKVNGTTVASGTQSASLPLILGSNTITAIVKAQDGTTTKTYTITVSRLPELSNLSITSGVGVLTPAFAADTTSYTVGVPHNINYINVFPVTADKNVTIKVNGATVVSGTRSANLPVKVGSNTITTIVTAQDGVTTKTYTITVARPPGLSSLAISSGTLAAVYQSGNLIGYTATVSYSVTSITVTPATSDSGDAIQVNGAAVASAAASASLPLNAGANIITVLLTSQDGTTSSTTTITVTRLLPPPAISYSSPQTYFVGTAITPLTPVASKVTKNISYTPFQEFVNYYNVSANDMVSDGAGNLYVADVNKGILKLSANGATLDTLATFPRPAEAQLVAIDSIGNVYAFAGMIYKIPAGGGTPVAITPVLTTIRAMRADAAGNVFYLTGTIASATSIVKIPAGGGPPVTVASGTFPGYNKYYPMAVDANDNIYVRDGNGLIEKIPAGGGSPVEITTTSRIGATGLAVDAIGNVYYASSIGSVNQSFIGIIEAATSQNKVICDHLPFISQMAIDGAGDAFSQEYEIGFMHPLGGYFLSKPLPAGLSFDQATGTISGTPTATSPATDYIITGYNVNGGTHATVNIGVITSVLHDALLTSLTTTPAAPLKQVTGPDYADYTTAVPYKTTSITVTPVTQNPAATIKVNGVAVASGTASASIPLSVGSNVINTVVTAADGATVKTYSITVTRRANSALAKLLLSTGSTLTTTTGPANANYAASVPAATTSLTVTPVTEDPAATVTVNGVAVTSGTPSQVISLTGSPTIINLVVTASDGSMTTYSVAVSKNGSSDAFLSRFLLSTGSSLTAAPSGPAEANYTASVTAGTTSLTVTPVTGDPGASVTINGTPVASGTASGAISLTTDPTVISAVVTAADGTILTYSISVSKDGSGDAFLSRLLLSTGSLLTPTLGDGNANYSASVDPSTTSLMITPVTRDPAATVTVDGTAVTSGTASAPIGLVVGDNLVTIVVTAPSGNTLTYTVDVNRPVEPDNTVYQPISVEKPANSPQFDDDMIGVHQGLSPNGDGINDFLVIDGILAYPDNRLAIMNRNGMLIYEAEGYDNTTKVFDGHSNKTGQMQLPGTYFYTLDYTVKGITKHKTGFIVLKY